jgi:hypothetical protein
MVPSLVVNGAIIKSMELDNIHGLMAGAMKDFGMIIICMNLEYINGRMENNTLENIMMTRSRVLEFTHGKTVESTQDTGKTINNMV